MPILRQATAEDAAKLLQATQRDFPNIINTSWSVPIVIRDDATGDFAGMLWILVFAAEPSVAILDRLSIEPEFRTGSFARTLLQDVVTKAANQGFSTLRAYIAADRTQVRNLFESEGFSAPNPAEPNIFERSV